MGNVKTDNEPTIYRSDFLARLVIDVLRMKKPWMVSLILVLLSIVSYGIGFSIVAIRGPVDWVSIGRDTQIMVIATHIFSFGTGGWFYIYMINKSRAIYLDLSKNNVINSRSPSFKKLMIRITRLHEGKTLPIVSLLIATIIVAMAVINVLTSGSIITIA
ncbi:hypothetical protein ACFLWS_04460 [Chloroflexota bacterium]